MATKAFSSFEERLSWKAFTDSMLEESRDILREPHAKNNISPKPGAPQILGFGSYSRNGPT